MENALVLFIVFGGAIAADWKRWKQAGRNEKIVWLCLMAFAAYLGLDLLLDVSLPHVSWILDQLFTPIARGILRMLGYSN